MKKGFTLLELVLVVIILGILAVIAIPRILANLETARGGEAYSTMRSIASAEMAYFANNGAFIGSFPIAADLDSDGTTDINLVQPMSPNFTYTIPVITLGTARISAARTAATGGRRSYGMCIESGETCSAAAASCDPGC